MRKITLTVVAAASLLSVPALAQTTTTDPAMGDTMMTAPVEDDDDFPWGLLGLLGLAGLLGRKRNDHDTVRRTP